MGIYRASDSMSRCDPNAYSSIYDLRKSPAAKEKPVVETSGPRRKDTIEFSRDKLKKDGLDRIRHISKFTVAQTGFMRIGKYLFLGVALPPYLVLYGIPRWLLVEGLPSLLSVTLWVYKKVQQQVGKGVEVGRQKINTIIRYVQRLTQALLKPLVHLALQIQYQARQLKEFMLRPYRTFVFKAKNAIQFFRVKVPRAMTQGPRDFASNIKKRMAAAKAKWTEAKEAVQGKVQQSIEWIKETPLLFLGWGQAQAQRLNEQLQDVVVRWKNHLQPSHRFAMKAANWTALQLKRSLGQALKPFASLARAYQKNVSPHWIRVRTSWSAKWNETKQFFQGQHRRALIYIQERQKKLKKISYDHLLQRLFALSWIKNLPLRLQTWLKWLLTHSMIRKMGERVVKLTAACARVGLNGSEGALLAFSKMSKSIGAFIGHFYSLVNQTKGSAASSLGEGGRKLQSGAFYALYYLLLSITIITIVSAWSVGYLVKSGNSLLSTFSFRKKK